jgi:hypothetical protein
LLTDYATFNSTGQKLALDLFRERRVAESIPIALAAAEAEDGETANAGYRTLREAGTPKEAEIILARLPKTQGRGEAQTAFVAIARRDASGTCTAMLRKTIEATPEEGRAIFYETAARLGGEQFLGDVEKSASSANAEISAAAIRALSAWIDASAAPALMRLALTAPEARNQTLALNGVKQKITAKETDKNALREQWNKIRETPGSDETKNAINELFQ